MVDSEPRRSTLGLVLLALLYEAPMHPYAMQQKIKQRGHDQLVNVAQRNSVYQALERLVRAGLARPRSTAREAGRPERTVYEVTDRGADTMRRWIHAMLPTPAREFPEFPVALAMLATLAPATAHDLLDERRTAQQTRLAALRAEAPPGLPRVFLIEDEYRAALLTAEIDWLTAVVADLAAGTFTWDLQLLADTLEKFG